MWACSRAQAQLSQAESFAARLRIAASAELQRLRQEALSAAARARSYEVDIQPRARDGKPWPDAITDGVGGGKEAGYAMA